MSDLRISAGHEAWWDNARAQCVHTRQWYREGEGSRICPPVDRDLSSLRHSEGLSCAVVFSEPHVLCLGQADLRSLTAAKSGVESATSVPVQLIGAIYVLRLTNFKGLLVRKATNMSEDQPPASGQIAYSTSSESPSLTLV